MVFVAPLMAPALRRLRSGPIRTVLRWQLFATLGMAGLAGVWGGANGALSAVLGGMVNIAAGVVFAVVGSLGVSGSAAGALLAVLRAEAAKVGVIVLLLWLVLTTYDHVVMLAFFGSFVVTVVIFAMAVAVRDEE